MVLDYGSGNLRSAERAVARAGVRGDGHRRSRGGAGRRRPGVPGVGAFAACMAGLTAVGGPAVIAQRRAAGRPTAGHLRRAPGAVRGRASSTACAADGLRGLARRGRGAAGRTAAAHGLEHRGAAEGSALFAGIEGERFYFVHSYGVRELPEAAGRKVTWAEHGGDRFVAAVEEGPVWSTQFHPEKSGDAGARLIANWVATL